MATKKAASNAKKSTTKPPVAKKQTTTKVTTVKAVESHTAHRSASARNVARRFGLMRTPLVAALIAEFIGTFIFAGAVIASSGQPLYVLFAIIGVVLAIGTISGGYANPALVIGAWVTRRMSGKRAAAYVVAQILGAMLAFVVLNLFVSAVPQAATAYGSAAPELFKIAALPAGHEWFVFWSEVIGMTIFGFAVASATVLGTKRLTAAFTVGLGLFLGLMVAGSAAAYLSATAVLNPAVAVALQGITFTSVWPITIYFVGAMLGGVIGFVLHDYLRAAQKTA